MKRTRLHFVWTVSIVSAVLCSNGMGAPQEDSPPIRPQPLRVVAYNIKHGRGMDGEIDLDRIARVIRRMNPDLVALQEVDRVCERSGKRDIAAELGRKLKMHPSFGMFMPYQGGEYGMAVLSRFPIKESVRHPLPKGAEPRCALEVTVEPPGFSSVVSFVSIHNDWTKKEYRVAQVRALLEALQRREHPVILAGDFNAERGSPSMKLLDEKTWTNLDKKGQKTFPSDTPRVEIDFVVLRGFRDLEGATCSVHEESVASDHRPVLAVIPIPAKR